MEHPDLEVADIFRAHGPAWRQAQRGHLSLGQLKVMSAIEQCRSAALGGHALRCDTCEHVDIAYNSCRNRHCPKCQAGAARRWLEARRNELLPVEYYHVVFTLPATVAALAWHNKSVLYRLLFELAAQTLCTIAADPKHLGARIGATLVLHTWGSALTHHPHVHGIVPGGGLSQDGERWVACRRGFFLPVRVLSRLFRRRFLEALGAAHRAGQLRFLGEHAALTEPTAFARWMAPLRRCEWVVYAKRPFAGPEAVLAYLSRYTHRVAISNRRLVAMDERGVTFRWKDYRAKDQMHKTMTLGADEFMRRFLLHVLPSGFHRIRHYGLFANAGRKANLARARALLRVPAPAVDTQPVERNSTMFICRHCGAPMAITAIFLPIKAIQAPARHQGAPP
ncbi:IS91 family transposase [Massilia cavernae]|uniref:IS91 family transposase n=3 Tax=Massilia cavernae TaxID=2320864 RepID=A0A418XE05_9BURK|nr:IS91 family transposase [Massilia cavernae]RJG08427.1 IS91 family transposase [Massilia cavernae]RJG09525.1 IS91 family transposase [Massilia cavernae]RJG10746.1 IS91 family transposase [Massilia cavernae]RJG11319.1 IS91 family transposase [Massilia cavernae]RJG15618.1 IS91 family transposase [Massilia cavernae]